jgi:8-oxo-dGTP diphosphatase
VEPDESPEAALVREIREELGVGLRIEAPPARYESSIGDRAFVFLVYPASFADQSLILSAHDEWRFFTAGELEGLGLAPLDGPALGDWAARA